MKLSRLLAASSAAALMAGAAHAVVEIAHNPGGSVPPGYEIAEEVDFAALALANDDDGTYNIEVGVDGTIPPGQNLFLTIEVTNGAFTTALNGAEFTSGTSGAVVDSGGTVGSSTVRYLITSDIGATISPSGKFDHVALLLPIDILGCGDLSFQVTEFETESGTPIEGGSAALSAPSVTCVEAYAATIVPDADVTTLDFNTGFSTFIAALPDSASNAFLGDATLTVDISVNIDMDGTLASPGDVLGFDADVNFANGDNIVDVNATPVLGTLFSDTAPVVADTAALAGAAAATLAAETGTIDINIVGVPPAPVAAQTVTVSGAALTLNTGLSLQASDPFNAADVQDLILSGQTFGPFDWVADATGATNNIFRVTGLSAADVPAQLILENSNAGVNGVFPFTILASEINNGELRINRQRITSIVGSNYGTADVTFVFSTGDSLDIDRLLATSATSAVVTSFGDGSNQDGPADAIAQP